MLRTIFRALQRTPLLAALLVAAPVAQAQAQSASTVRIPDSERAGFARVPFDVGETFNFRLQVKWGFVSGNGTASLSVENMERVNGHPTYRLGFRTKGGIAMFGINDMQRSWLDARTLFARRFEQKLQQTGYSRDKTYDFVPERMQYVNIENAADTGPLASAIPLDDVSFIYFIRTLPLKVGDEYTAPRYFKADGNPVTVRVLRTERITVPTGSYNAVVVKPIIRTKGLFSEGGEAEVWFSDDARHIPLKVRAKVSVATLTMELQSVTMPAVPAGSPQRP